MIKFLEAVDNFGPPLPVWIALFILVFATFVWLTGNAPDLLYNAYHIKEIELMERVCQFDAGRRAGNNASRQKLCSDKHSYLITTESIATENETSAVEVRLIIDWHTDDGNIPGISDALKYSNGCPDYLRESERIGYAEDVLRRTVVNKMIADFYDRKHSDIMSMSHESLAKHIKGIMSKTMNGITIDGIEVLYAREPGQEVK